MDLAKYRRDRFARIRRISRSGGVLRVHSRSPIPRTHAYFEGFSARSENRETGWRRGVDSNCRYRFLNSQTTTFRRRLQRSDEKDQARSQRVLPPDSDQAVSPTRSSAKPTTVSACPYSNRNKRMLNVLFNLIPPRQARWHDSCVVSEPRTNQPHGRLRCPLNSTPITTTS